MPVPQSNVIIITTTSATTVGAVKATLAGSITADGGTTVTERGVVWATTINPTTANTKVAIGTGIGVFSQLVTGLPAVTLVHFRAYAINSAGTSYGSDLTFTTNAALSASQSSTNVSCNGGSNGAASVVVSGGVTSYTYSWSPSGGTATTASGLSAGSYTCTITDNEGTQITKNFTVTQPTTLTSSISTQTNVSCNGGSNGSATVSVSGRTAGYTYAWSPSGGLAATVSGLSPGTYTCTITDANACTKTQSVNITQPAPGNSNVTQSAGILTASQTGATYQWYKCPNTLLTGATNQTYTPTATGDYKVTVTVGGCSITSTCVTVTTLGTDSFTINSGLKIYPNPTNSNVTVEFANLTNAKLQVIDINGKVLMTQSLNETNNNINTNGLPAGMYMFKISSAEGSTTSKVVKQ